MKIIEEVSAKTAKVTILGNISKHWEISQEFFFHG